MNFEIGKRGIFQVIRIRDELDVVSDLTELLYLVQGYMKQGRRHIAVGFSGMSYIYSGAVAMLIRCHRELKREDGELCIIEPNENIRPILNLLHIDQVLRVLDSVEDLDF